MPIGDKNEEFAGNTDWSADLFLGGAAVAADAVDLVVSGNVVPVACTPTLSATTIDWGTRYFKDLSATAHSDLGYQFADFTINCSADAKVAIELIDNRAGTESALDPVNMGLGLAPDGSPVGYHRIDVWDTFVTGSAVSEAGNIVESKDGGSSWQDLVDPSPWLGPVTIYALAESAVAEPGAFSTHYWQLGFKAYIAPTSQLPADSAIEIDGSVTIELVYL